MSAIGDHPPEWHDRRRLYVGSSDAPIIMGGDLDAIEGLRLKKLGRGADKPIMGAWGLALRKCTEDLQMDWYQFSTGHRVSRRGEHIVSPQHPRMAAELDGYAAAINAVIDAKHMGEYHRDHLVWCREHYAWQIVHQMVVANADLGMLSIIHGTKEPQILTWEYDPFSAQELIDRVDWFWSHVEGDIEIEGISARKYDSPAGVSIKALREVDMSGSNQFAAFAADWLSYRSASKAFDAAVVGLRGCIEGDVGRATGHGIEVRRSKSGSILIKEMKNVVA